MFPLVLKVLIFFNIFIALNSKWVPRYNNNTMKIFLVLRFLNLFTRKVWEMFVYNHTETIEYIKK